MQRFEKSVKNINYCYGCGICAGICHRHALSMTIAGEIGYYKPQFDKEKCNNCGHCLQICPWNSFDMDLMNEKIYNKSNNDICGQHLGCYTGYSTDKEIRSRSSSGGIIPEILIYMLKKKIVDGIIVTKIFSTYPLKVEPFIAMNETDLISAIGSKYISVSFDQVFKDIINFNGKLAIVGLPCHIQAIRKLELIDKEAKNKIIYHLGLMCSGTAGTKGSELMIDSFKIPRESINSIAYRGEGWPGGFKVKTKNVLKIVPYPVYLPIARTYLQPSCLVCWDALNEFSDISFGDAWKIANENEMGTSLLITRTAQGDSLLKMIESDGKIRINKIDDVQMMSSQMGNIKFKKRILRFRLILFKYLFGEEPNFRNIILYKNLDINGDIRTIMLFVRTYLANGISSKMIYPILMYILRRNIICKKILNITNDKGK